MILATFALQVIPMLLTKFGVNWPFGSGVEAKNSFSSWLPWRPSWISDWNNFSYFCSSSHPDASYQVLSQLAQGCRMCRLLKQLLTLQDGRSMTDDWHWLTTIAHHEHFVLRWAKKVISVDPDQSAPSGAVWSGSTLFAYAILLATLVYKILGHLPYIKL